MTSTTTSTAGRFDGLPLGRVVTQLSHLIEGEECDTIIGHGECRTLIGQHYQLARERVLASFGLTTADYEDAVIERLGDTRLAFDLRSMA